MRFDCTPNSTNTIRGERTAPIASTGAKKKGFTVVLCAGIDGSKLPALIVFKERNEQLGPRVLHQLTIPANVRITIVVWCSSTSHFRPHMCDTVKAIADELSTDLVSIPAECTSIAQPLDVSITKPFKDRRRKQWVEWMQTATRNDNGNIRQPTPRDVINWPGSLERGGRSLRKL